MVFSPYKHLPLWRLFIGDVTAIRPDTNADTTPIGTVPIIIAMIWLTMKLYKLHNFVN